MSVDAASLASIRYRNIPARHDSRAWMGRLSVLALTLALVVGCGGRGSTVTTSTALEGRPLVVEPALVPGSWRAGVATGALFAPVGLSMGGYGFRPGPATPLQEHLGGSLGRYQTLLVKALALTNGHGALVLVKLPMIFPSDPLRRRVVQKLAARTGYDFGDALVLTATHTHSGPARFWALPRGVGIFGLDEFDPAVLDRLADSIAEVVATAWSRLEPARIGAAELLRFDPEDRITADRRSENDNLYTDVDADPNLIRKPDGTIKSKDHRYWVLRVDTAEGEPLAAIVRFGIHGTVLVHELFSEDAPGMIERAVERLWGVPVALFVQGAAGDVTPTGDDHGRRDLQAIEAIALRAARVGKPLYEGITTQTEGVLGVVHRRRQLSRAVLGYRDDEFGERRGGRFWPYRYGAFQCGEFGADPPPDGGNPETRLQDGQLGCLPMEQLMSWLVDPSEWELPPAELSVAVQTGIRLGDWWIVTFPGEPVSTLQREMLRVADDAGFERVTVFGYAQTHLFYLTPAEDWFQGGYEAAMNIWGWKLGDFLVNQNVALLERLRDARVAPAWDGDPERPVPLERTSRSVPIRLAAEPPHWLQQPATTVAPFQVVDAAFTTGGDSWTDAFRVYLEYAQDGSWTTVADDSGFGWRVLVDIGAEPQTATIRFEPGLELTPGRYRFRVEGRAGGGYTLTSAPFMLAETTPMLAVTGAVVGVGELRLYPAVRPHAPTYNRLLEREALYRYQETAFRLISTETGPEEPTPITTGVLHLEGRWYPAGTTVAAELVYDTTCRCYPWTVVWPPATTRLELVADVTRVGRWALATTTTIDLP